MLDFYDIREEVVKKGAYKVGPEFLITSHPKDVMIRGKDFYAVWIESTGLWSPDEGDVITLIDNDTRARVKELREKNPQYTVEAKYMRNSRSGLIDEWHKYCQRQMRDHFKVLDNKIIFRNTATTKKDYVSKKLPYDLVDGPCEAWDEIVSTLYSEEEQRKIEWTIGAIFSGDSKSIQKFLVFYGDGGTGKSTIMNIMERLFDGYWSRFNAKELASSNNSFALESFRNNPLVSIQHDGDLSKIEDNTLLNSIVSHESMEVNEKFKSKYMMNFNTFLIMGTNKPVKITEAKSGIIRRLIDVRPTGKKIPRNRYDELMSKVEFELGEIASHCLKVYKTLGKSYYDNYIPKDMISSTNEFYNFVEENYDLFLQNNGIAAKTAYVLYKGYCTDTNVPYQMTYTRFRVEFANYFEGIKDRCKVGGTEYYNYYYGFKWEKFPGHEGPKVDESIEDGPYGIAKGNDGWIIFKDSSEYDGGSLFDFGYEGQTAQYAKEDGSPRDYWVKVKTKLSDLDTSKLHYVLLPENHIVIDFDIKNENGEKDLALNLAAANKFPKTYAETSKSGAGIHLHYIYDGDASELSHIYDDHIEIKTFGGKAPLRRKLSKCNDIAIAHINSGLPLKGVKNTVVNFEAVNIEKALETTIKKCLMKEVHSDTTSNVDFIKKILDDAYASGKPYSVDPKLRHKVMLFASNSTNQSEKCLRTVAQMKWESEEPEMVEVVSAGRKRPKRIIFFDWEVFPNFCCMCWKEYGKEGVVKMINPTPEELISLLEDNLVGFNNKDYDNHIYYARAFKRYSNKQLYELSNMLINGSREESKAAKFREAYGLSYTDVYDFVSKKQGLKKYEIELGLFHLENEHPWDQDLPEDAWNEVATYCANDVIATEAVFDKRKEDFSAREILADLAMMLAGSGSVNDSTNQLTTKIILRGDKNANKQFVKPDLSKLFPGYKFSTSGIDKSEYTDPKAIVKGKSIYMGEDPGEGGYVYANPGMYYNVTTFDVASMHPSSIIAENGFGIYTDNFKQLLDIRLHIKHKEYDKVKEMFNGALAKYLTATDADELKKQAKSLSFALKIAINAVYGQTSASYPNDLRDPNNKDNWVAKRGALMMIALKNEVLKRGFTVVHCKTDSIKVVNVNDEMADFIYDFGKKYGYTFEIEAKYDRICLVNESTYIAKESDWEGNEEPGCWSGTGAQFKKATNPYVFKTLFSKDQIIFDDMCETKSVTSAMYLDMNEGLSEDVHNYRFVGRVGKFTPIISGAGGGELLRKSGEDKYGSVTDTKGYRWLESDTVEKLHLEDKIDKSFYLEKCNTAIDAISKYGDFDEFVNGPSKPLLDSGNYIPPDFMNIPEGVGEEGIPFENVA